MVMHKYHAGRPGFPLCGARGTGNRYNVVVFGPADWNALKPEQRCSRCVEQIQKRAEKVAKGA
jgi:hypothetical protein